MYNNVLLDGNKKKNLYFYFLLSIYFFNKIIKNQHLIDYNTMSNIEKKIVFLDFYEYKLEDYLLNYKSLLLERYIFNNNFVIKNKEIKEFRKYLKKKILYCKENINNKKSIILNNTKNDYDLVRKIDNYNKEYKNINCFNNIFEYVNNIKKKNSCPICREKIVESQLLITDCGHSLCLKCFLNWKDKNKKCPECRKALNINDLTHIIKKSNQIKILEFYNIEYITRFIGTKLTFIIKYIYENKKKNRVMFLSENITILNIVSEILNKFYLENTIYNNNNPDDNSIILYNYNTNNKKMKLSKKTVIIFNEIINKEKEKYILSNISNDLNMITKTINFIIRGTKEEDIISDQL